MQLSKHTTNEPGRIDVSSVNFRFFPSERISIGQLPTLHAVQGSFEIGTDDGKFMHARTIFHLSGETEDRELAINVRNEEFSKIIEATIHPTEDVSVARVLAAIFTDLPTLPFSPVIEKLQVDTVKLTLIHSEHGADLQSCQINLMPSAALDFAGGHKASGLELACQIYTLPSGEMTSRKWSINWTETGASCAGVFTLLSTVDASSTFSLSFKPQSKGNTTAYGILDTFSISRNATSAGSWVPLGTKVEEYQMAAVKRLDATLELDALIFKISDLNIQVFRAQDTKMLILQTRNIYVEDIAWNIHYEGKTAISLRESFTGSVRILKNFLLPVTFEVKEAGVQAKGSFAFDVKKLQAPPEGEKRQQDQSVQLFELIEQLVPSTDPALHSENYPRWLAVSSGRALFMPLQSVTIFANAFLSTWKISFGMLDIILRDQLQSSIYMSEADTDKTWAIVLRNETAFSPGLTARVEIQLRRNSEPVMTLRLKKSAENSTPGFSADVFALVQQFTKNSDRWKTLWPSEAPTLALSMYSGLYLDLHKPRTLLFTGSILAHGGVAILVQESGSEYEFLVALQVTDPTALWKKLKPTASDHFNIMNASAYFSSTTWSQETLFGPVDQASAAPKALSVARDQHESKDDDGYGPADTAAKEFALAKTLFTIPPAFNSPNSNFQEAKSLPSNTISAGAYIMMEIALGDGQAKGMSEALTQSVEPDKKPKLVLLAKLTGEETSFDAIIPEFVILGGFITFRDCHGKFTWDKKSKEHPDGVPTLTLEAKMEIKIPDFDDLLKIQANIDITTEKLVANIGLAEQTSTKITQSSGIDLTLEMLAFSAEIQFRKTDRANPVDRRCNYWLDGRLKFGSTIVSASLIFDGSKPMVLTGNVEKLSLETVMRGIHGELLATPEQAPADASAPMITFDLGHISYVFPTLTTEPWQDPRSGHETEKYNNGLNVDGTVSILRRKIHLRAQIVKGQGKSTVRGSFLEAIDLGLIVFSKRDEDSKELGAGPNVRYEWSKGGTTATNKVSPSNSRPTIIFQSSVHRGIESNDEQSLFEIDSKVSILNSFVFTCSIGFLPSTKDFQTTHAYSPAADAVGNPGSQLRIVFKDNRIFINGWDIEKVFDDLNLANALMQAPNTTSCAALVGLIFDQTLKFRIRFGLNLDIDDSAKVQQGVPVRLTIAFVVLLSDTVKLDEIKVPDWNEVIPYNMNGEAELFKWLLEITTRNIGELAKHFLDHPQDLARVISWMSVKKYSKQLLEALICREVKPENVLQRYQEILNEERPKSDPPAPTPPPPTPILEPERPRQKCECRGGFWEQLLCACADMPFH